MPERWKAGSSSAGKGFIPYTAPFLFVKMSLEEPWSQASRCERAPFHILKKVRARRIAVFLPVGPARAALPPSLAFLLRFAAVLTPNGAKIKRTPYRCPFVFGDPPEIQGPAAGRAHRCFLPAGPARAALPPSFAFLLRFAAVLTPDGAKIKRAPYRCPFVFGDPPEIRTPDPLLKRQLLCQLS